MKVLSRFEKGNAANEWLRKIKRRHFEKKWEETGVNCLTWRRSLPFPHISRSPASAPSSGKRTRWTHMCVCPRTEYTLNILTELLQDTSFATQGASHNPPELTIAVATHIAFVLAACHWHSPLLAHFLAATTFSQYRNQSGAVATVSLHALHTVLSTS